MPFERLQDLVDRLLSYSWWEVAIELVCIWFVVYALVRFVQGTRAAGVLKGLLLVLVIGTLTVRVISAGDAFQRLAYLFDRLLALFAVVMVVVFAPELRRAFSRLGEAQLLRSAAAVGLGDVVDDVATACIYLSRQRFGAIIALERRIGLRGLIQGGTNLDAEVSTRLLQTIFFPGSALHDLAVIIRGRRIVAASVQLPLADPSEMPDPMLGSRHRAAVGLTKETDALVVIVSEESGLIRISERGRLSKAYGEEELADELRRRLGVTAQPGAEAAPERGEAA
ncbi:MAG: TIGR00159 family protein [Phycisphaeraceae bacterium]|nr:MAG: TIGR00159 family protein [Phycisphaeraceae bacterium]